MAIKDRLYRVPVLGTALRVQDRYRDDAADALAASIGFFGFLSLFPLVILAVAVVGFVAGDDPQVTADVAEAIRGAIPGLEGLTGTDAEGLIGDIARNAGAIAGIGAITLLLAGLRVVNGAMVATTRVFRLPQPEGVKGWLRKLGALALLGLLALGGAVASSVVGIDFEVVPTIVSAGFGALVAFGFDLLLFLVAYRVLAAAEGPAWRELLPGAVLAALGWTALKALGSTWVASQVGRANDLYGVFGGIIALLLLFYLAGRLYLYGAELSAHLCEREDPDRFTRDDDGASLATALAAHGTEGHAPRPGNDTATGTTTRFDGGQPRGEPTGRSRPAAPRPDERAPTISRETRARLRYNDALVPTRADVRGAIAFLLAVGAVGGLVYALRPWETDDA